MLCRLPTGTLCPSGRFIWTLAMMDKDPGFLAAAWSAIDGLSDTVKGAAMAFFIAYLRILYDGKESRQVRVILESLICGGLSLCFATVIGYLNMPSDIAIAAGGAIGFLGVNKLSAWIGKWIGKQVD
jgi:lambda family phage holin